MGHQWPGADWPENHDDSTNNAGGDRGERDYRRPAGNDWTSWGQALSGGGRGRRAGGPPPWLGEIFGFANAQQRPSSAARGCAAVTSAPRSSTCCTAPGRPTSRSTATR